MAIGNERFGNPVSGSAIGGTDQSSSIGSMASEAGDQLMNAAGQAQDAAQVQMDKLADCIRRSPLQSAGIAAGIGFLVALMVRR